MKMSVLLEEIAGIDKFAGIVTGKFINDGLKGDHKKFKSLFIDSIEKSGCQKIDFGDFSFGYALGLSLHNRVIINKVAIRKSMGMLLYIIFHEIAHQYQYRKYGVQRVYNMYIRNKPIIVQKTYNDKILTFSRPNMIIDKKDIDFLRQLENTADEYGLRKSREFVKYGFINQSEIPEMPININKTDDDYKYILEMFINALKNYGNEDYSPEKISDTLFNFFINKN